MVFLIRKRDARQLGQEAREEVRRQAVRLVKPGMSRKAVAEQLEVSRQHVGDWYKRYQVGGWASLRKGKRGRPVGRGRRLSAEQEAEVQRLITGKLPDQL
ncbi:MAG: helix-turn-helix domain-containing protein [Verrucomicrobiae bacterium]|nr:helix-turn-helix domain-containing protein [Verrucomicrobiae bacterium]